MGRAHPLSSYAAMRAASDVLRHGHNHDANVMDIFSCLQTGRPRPARVVEGFRPVEVLGAKAPFRRLGV